MCYQKASITNVGFTKPGDTEQIISNLIGVNGCYKDYLKIIKSSTFLLCFAKLQRIFEIIMSEYLIIIKISIIQQE